jgi:hypothetical protein
VLVLVLVILIVIVIVILILILIVIAIFASVSSGFWARVSGLGSREERDRLFVARARLGSRVSGRGGALRHHQRLPLDDILVEANIAMSGLPFMPGRGQADNLTGKILSFILTGKNAI